MKKSQKSSGKGKVVDKPEVVKLPAILDITSAHDLLDTLREAVAEHSAVRLSGEKVTRITTPCIQVLLSASKTLSEAGGKLTVEAPSAAFTEAMNDLGLANQLQVWSA